MSIICRTVRVLAAMVRVEASNTSVSRMGRINVFILCFCLSYVYKMQYDENIPIDRN